MKIASGLFDVILTEFPYFFQYISGDIRNNATDPGRFLYLIAATSCAIG